MKSIIAIIIALASFTASACNSDINIVVYGSQYGDSVELRQGTPGNSRIVGSAGMNSNVCPGNYFIAVGDGKTVSVSGVRYIGDNTRGTWTVQVQRGVGNMTTMDRSRL